MRRAKGSAARQPGPPPRPPRPVEESSPDAPSSLTTVEEKKTVVEFTPEMRRTMAERLTDAEAQIYNGWAAMADNDGYRLNELERRGMVDSYDMLLQLYGAEWGGKMLGIIMFSAAHATPIMCRILVKPRKGSTERANGVVRRMDDARKGAAPVGEKNDKPKVTAPPAAVKDDDDDDGPDAYDGGDDD